MARRFAKVSEEEIEEAFFFLALRVYCTTTPLKFGGYIPRRFASRYISATIDLPFG